MELVSIVLVNESVELYKIQERSRRKKSNTDLFETKGEKERDTNFRFASRRSITKHACNI